MQGEIVISWPPWVSGVTGLLSVLAVVAMPTEIHVPAAVENGYMLRSVIACGSIVSIHHA